jgi:uncharacterized protein YjiS (DUF1127 family)
MLRKHHAGRISLANIASEISMPFANSLSDAPWSSRVRALRLIGQHISSEPTPESDDESETSLLPLPRQEPPRRTIRAAVSGLMAKTVAFSVHAGSVLPSVPIAIVSWLLAEFFAGCAAYAQAMYPFVPLEDDGVDRGNPLPAAASHPRPASRGRPILRLVPTMVERGIERDRAVAFPVRSKPGSHPASRTESLSQPDPARTARAGSSASIGATMTALLSKVRVIRAGRRAAKELDGIDDRTLRDIGTCHCDIEAIVRQDSQWE